jgi:hypothetical protein
MNVAVQFAGNSIALSGAVSPTVPSPLAPSNDLAGSSSRTQISTELLNGISQRAYQVDTVDLDAGGSSIKLNQFRFQISKGDLNISARIQSAKPGCDVRVNTIWSGADLKLADVLVEDTPSLQSGACALEKGKWSLVAVALKNLYQDTPLRPTRLQAINTTINGLQVKIFVLIKRTLVDKSNIVFLGDVWLGIG